MFHINSLPVHGHVQLIAEQPSGTCRAGVLEGAAHHMAAIWSFLGSVECRVHSVQGL